jgi:hypothetical protein
MHKSEISAVFLAAILFAGAITAAVPGFIGVAEASGDRDKDRDRDKHKDYDKYSKEYDDKKSYGYEEKDPKEKEYGYDDKKSYGYDDKKSYGYDDKKSYGYEEKDPMKKSYGYDDKKSYGYEEKDPKEKEYGYDDKKSYGYDDKKSYGYEEKDPMKKEYYDKYSAYGQDYYKKPGNGGTNPEPKPIDLNFYVVEGNIDEESFGGFAVISSTATCDDGDEVTGGGFELLPVDETGDQPDAEVVVSAPFENGDEGWTATGTVDESPTTTSSIQAYAVCFDNPPKHQQSPTQMMSGFGNPF